MKNNNNNNKNGGMIPTSSKKMIQNLKEIVNCSEAEIYAMLQDCNMDPNEAVHRLLSQDPFHEVKSKREKKKENKDGGDLRSRGTSRNSTRGSWGGVDRYSGRSNTTQFGSSDYGASRGKPAYKKDYGANAYTNSAVGSAGNNMYRRQTAASDISTDIAIPVNTADGVLATPQPSSFQSAWSGVAGQVSMADIVKMGKPQGKTSSNLNYSQQQVNNQYMGPSAGLSLPHESLQSQYHAAKLSEVNPDSEFAGSHHVPPNDDWPLDEEPPAVGISSAVEPNVNSEQYGDHYDRTDQQFRSLEDNVQFEQDSAVNEHESIGGSVPGPNQNMQENNTGHASAFDNDMYQNSFPVDHQEVEDFNVSAVTDNFQTLTLPKEDEDIRSEEDGPAVKIPHHLQVKSAECSHLSFGSFGSGMNAPFSESSASRVVGDTEEEAAVGADAPSMVHSEARNSEYYEEEHIRPTSDVTNASNMGTDTFDAPSVSQSDMLKQEAPEAVQVNQYPFSSAAANYSFENSQQRSSPFPHPPTTSSHVQALPSLAGVMAYSSSLPGALLASNVQPHREAELAYSPFSISQSAAAKYGIDVSSISGANASMAEALKTGNFPSAQPTQTPSGAGISAGSALPQHLAVHPYSQHSVPLGPLNMMGYPFLPQSYTYMPPAFPQAFAAGNSTYPQSLAAAVLPQYKNSVSVSSLPQSAALPSGYGAFGNSNSIPNSFPLNPPSAPAGTSMNYDDVLSSQYKDASHLLSLQQGPGSRTLSGVPGSTYYNFQGQTQQPAGFRQSQQQPSQHYGPHSGYPNFYHSQAGLSLEHQQQMARDGSLGGSQGQQAKQTQQQLWQNSY